MSRKSFVQSKGAICKNWSWSWSFVNHKKREVLFGLWDIHTKKDRAIVLDESWKGRIRKSPGYNEALENIQLVENEGYQLKTFRMIYSNRKKDSKDRGPASIKKIFPELNPKQLHKIGKTWYAVDDPKPCQLVLFVRVAWMKFYAGSKSGDDRPYGLGNLNHSDRGIEMYNFQPNKNYLYGGIPAVEKIDLTKINPEYRGNTLNNVKVIFFSKHPVKNKGQVIIGWYKKADIYSTWHSNGIRNRNYLIKARHADAVLLPTINRIQSIPKGKNSPGQSNVFYLYNESGIPKKINWLHKVLKYTDDYNSYNLIIEPEAESYDYLENKVNEELGDAKGQGFQLDLITRKAIEDRAMEIATKYFKDKGFSVENVCKKKPYDLECHMNGDKFFVEVKGSQLSINKIILTSNEVALAKRYKKNMKPFLVSNIRVRNNGEAVKATKGEKCIIEPWSIDNKKLKAIQYLYDINL